MGHPHRAYEDHTMRKPRDFDTELKTLTDKARLLRSRKVQQLGELVIACGADALLIEQLAGALLAAEKAEPTAKEEWRKAGATFFQGARSTARRVDGRAREVAADARSDQPPEGGDRAT
jgi:NAD/NADP transhydrogenase alpha subunit